jgi:PAS domain S-box-containing protein
MTLRHPRSAWLGYAFAVLATLVAAGLRLPLHGLLGTSLPFLTFFAAIAASAWFGGLGPGLLATALGGFFSFWYLLSPERAFRLDDPGEALGLVLYVLVGAGISALFEALHVAQRRLERQKEELRVTLQSIGDGVIVTDEQGRVAVLNPVAESLTGWTQAEAAGRPLGEIFHIVHEDTRARVENPAARALDEGTVVGLANHTVLVARDGTERPIDDSAAPIRDMDGTVTGAILVFRDVSERRRIEEEFRRQARDFADLFDNANVGLHFVGPDGTILRVNRHELELLGYQKEEYVGRNIADFHVDPGNIADILTRLGAGETLHDWSARMRCKDGSTRDVLISSSVLWEDGRFLHTRCFTLDVTDRVRAEAALKESEERFRTLADNISTLAWTADTLGWADWYNRRWYEFTGRTFEEMKDRGWESLHHPDHLERVSQGLAKALEAGVPWEDTFPLRGRDGQYRWFLSRAVPIRDENGRITRWFGTNTDVTERIEMEAALRENDRRKDEFLATLAHELRNPLAPIRNSLALLRQPGAGPAEVNEARDIMDRQIGLMVRLIDDLLDLSRITRGTLELRRHRVELASVIHQAIETIRPLVDCARHELEVDLPAEPVHVDGDPMRLAQVFSNLLNNACKFTEPGGHITLKAARDGADVVVSVGDDGMGIPPDKLQTIFEMFAQLDRTLERSQSGLGIGLTIVKRIVEMHGGSIQVHSDGPGKGTTFHLRLPILVEAAETALPRDVPAPSRTAGRRVLVVDDNRDSADSLAMLLRLGGNETHVAHDGAEALDSASRVQPDLILLDLGLPRVNGYEVCERIRREPWGRHVTIIALTGWGQEEDRRRSNEAGFDDHLVKPVEHGELMRLLDGGVARGRSDGNEAG